VPSDWPSHDCMKNGNLCATEEGICPMLVSTQHEGLKVVGPRLKAAGQSGFSKSLLRRRPSVFSVDLKLLDRSASLCGRMSCSAVQLRETGGCLDTGHNNWRVAKCCHGRPRTASDLQSRRNEEQIKLGECLLPNSSVPAFCINM
jgi:hypothetical protein